MIQPHTAGNTRLPACHPRVVYMALTALCWTAAVRCFNVDTTRPVVLTPPVNGAQRETYFGHSVALLNVDGQAWALVGAPRSNSTPVAGPEPGTIYSCPLAGDQNECRTVSTYPNEGSPGSDLINPRYTSSWLGGVTLARTGEADPQLLTCASRWTNFYLPDNDYFLNGACFWSRAGETLSGAGGPLHEVLPLIALENQRKTINGGPNTIYYYQYGQAGFSATFMPRGGDVILGAPGLANWAGGIIRGSEGPSTSHGHGLLRTEVYNPPDTVRGYDYLGYSVAAGVFWGVSELVAASALRSDYTGKVLVLDLPPGGGSALVQQILRGPEPYGGFGWALAAVDLNGDDLEELVVGAPLMARGASPGGEDGCVFVYSSTGSFNRLKEVRQLIPVARGGRFGAAVASAGDLDRDGYNDLVVGAPSEGGGAGAIYIFMGGSMGVVSRPSQHITAASLDVGLAGFGISLSPGLDVDNNGYSDMAVGSSFSDRAVLLKTRAVLELNLSVVVEPAFLTKEEELFEATACCLYTGHGVVQTQEVTLTVTLDSRFPMSSRALFTANELTETTLQIHLTAGKRACSTLQAKLKGGVEDVEHTLTVTAKIKSDKVTNSVTSDTFLPVLSLSSNTTAEQQVVVAPGCGDDHSCQPTLQLQPRFVRTEQPYVVGSGSDVYIEIVLTATQEWAYQTRLVVALPPAVSVRALPAHCGLAAPAGDGSNRGQDSVTCQLPSPLRPDQKAVTNLALQVSATAPTGPAVFAATATAHNALTKANLTLELQHQVKLAVFGQAEPDRVHHTEQPNSTQPPLHFRLQVQNLGVTSAKLVMLRAWLPYSVGQVILFGDINVQRKDQSSDGPECRISVPATEAPSSVQSVAGMDGKIACNAETVCASMVCSLLNLGTDGVTLSTTVNTTAFQEAFGREAAVSVMLRTSAEWTGGDGVQVTESTSVSAIVAPFGWSETASTPWWVLLLSVLAGVTLLAAMVYLMYKCGFFKRTRPPTEGPQDEGTELLEMQSPDRGEGGAHTEDSAPDSPALAATDQFSEA